VTIKDETDFLNPHPNWNRTRSPGRYPKLRYLF